MDFWVGKYASVNPDVIVESVTGPGGACVDSALNVEYRVEGYFAENNVFTAELSSPTGSFANPFLAGAINSSVDGTINGSVPLLAPNGNGYRVRIVASNPVVTSNNNGTNLTINGQLSPPLIISNDTIVCNGSSVLPSISGDYVSQMWSTGATTPFTNITVPGPYWVMATDTNGCSQTFSFTVDECVSTDPALAGALQVYPNPGTGIFNLRAITDRVGTWEISVIDLRGSVLYSSLNEEASPEWEVQLDLSQLTNGIYFLRAGIEGDYWIQKLVIRR